MVFKRHLFKKKQLLIKYQFINQELWKKIKKSLFLNHYNHYKFRLSFNLNQIEPLLYDNNRFFKTFQKLVCPYSLSKKVPSKRLNFSRFFINKQINTLKINNMLK